MKITRAWFIPNKWTFKMKPVEELLSRYKIGKRWADPFCGESTLCEFRNDLNSKNENADKHLFAKDFLASFETASLDGVLFDPPYSPRQISECYKSIGLSVGMKDTQNQWTIEKENISRIVKPNGICISFGWNSNGVGKKRGFEIEEILMIAHGSSHNDTIVVVERKNEI